MKQIKWITILTLLAYVYACSDKNVSPDGLKTDKGLRDITFNLQREYNADFEGTTKTNGSIVPTDYKVLFYLFEQIQTTSDPDYEKFRLIRLEEITTSLYTLRNLNIDSYYRGVFIAAQTDLATWLQAKDFGTAIYGNEANGITLAGEAVLNKSLLENCYLELFGTATTPTYGNPNDPGARETFVLDRDIQIYGDGFELLAGKEYFTPVKLLMKRQMGIVEFECPDAQEGDILTSSFSSDYYRLYLSQLVKDFNLQKYSSENEAIFSPGPQGRNVPPNGDYYSSSFYFIHNSQSGLPVFQKTATMGPGETKIRMYVPYTTAEATGTAVSEINKANYKRTMAGSAQQGPEGSVKLVVNRNGILKTYEHAGTFPIYRNATTFFKATGESFLAFSFGNEGTGGGLNVDDDIWDGEQN